MPGCSGRGVGGLDPYTDMTRKDLEEYAKESDKRSTTLQDELGHTIASCQKAEARVEELEEKLEHLEDNTDERSRTAILRAELDRDKHRHRAEHRHGRELVEKERAEKSEARVKELETERKHLGIEWALLWRGVDQPCRGCGGAGVKAYGDTSTYSHGIGGQMMTSGVCDTCWGSGEGGRPWPSHRLLKQRCAAKASATQEGDG